MMYYGGGENWVWMLVSMTVTLVFLVGLVWIIARLAIDSKRRDDRPAALPEPDALTVLQRRFASGELDDDEYMRRRQVLLGNL